MLRSLNDGAPPGASAATALVLGIHPPERSKDDLGGVPTPALPELPEDLGSLPCGGDEALAVVGDELESRIAGSDFSGEEDLGDEVHGDDVDACVGIPKPYLGWGLEPWPL